MKILIQSPNEKTIRLFIPTRLFFNRFTALIGAGAFKKYVAIENTNIRPSDLYRLMKEFKRIKKKYPGFVQIGRAHV